MSPETATIHDRIGSEDPRLLGAIADHGDRLHVLRQLETGGSMSEMDARDVAVEVGLPATASVECVAETFVEEWQRWYDEVMNGQQQAYWAHYVERSYGERADALLGEE